MKIKVNYEVNDLKIVANADVKVRPGLFPDDLYCKDVKVIHWRGTSKQFMLFVRNWETHKIDIERKAITQVLDYKRFTNCISASA